MILAPLWRDLPLEITILNDYPCPEGDDAFDYRQGDACNLAEIADREFDVVHSESVIEHVGDWGRMMAFAREVRRIGHMRLLDYRRLAALFPDAEIERERFLGLTKSYVAIRW